jgi:hypothetical protein
MTTCMYHAYLVSIVRLNNNDVYVAVCNVCVCVCVFVCVFVCLFVCLFNCVCVFVLPIYSDF